MVRVWGGETGSWVDGGWVEGLVDGMGSGLGEGWMGRQVGKDKL